MNKATELEERKNKMDRVIGLEKRLLEIHKRIRQLDGGSPSEEGKLETIKLLSEKMRIDKELRQIKEEEK